MDATKFLRDTIDLIKQIETRFLELGARLYNIREKGMWKDSYESYEEFLDTAHVSYGNASMLASIHKAYVVEGKKQMSSLAGIGYSNLYEAIPLIEAQGVDAAIVKASTLTRAEIKQEVREEKHGECAHENVIKICSSCHKLMQ